MELEVSEIAFVDEYFKNGFKAGKAYLKVHPDVTPASARVLGSKLLAKVSKSDYFNSLRDESVMGKDEYLKLVSTKARKGNSTAIKLLGRLYIPTKVEGNFTGNITWSEFINSDAKADSSES